MAKKYKMWTLAELETLLALWDTSSYEDLEEELKRSRQQIQSMVYQLRKNGFKISNKGRHGHYKPLFAELRQKIGKK